MVDRCGLGAGLLGTTRCSQRGSSESGERGGTSGEDTEVDADGGEVASHGGLDRIEA